jgi:hypothetical protein
MFGSSSTLATDDPDTAALFGPDAAQGKLSYVVFVVPEWLGTVLFYAFICIQKLIKSSVSDPDPH